MINIQQQEELFIAVGKALEKKLEVYAIGGTAMMLRGIKDATLDVDLVFNNQSEREKLIFALKKIGAKESNSRIVYGIKPNTPYMLNLLESRFDLFLNKVITSTFSENMKSRAKQTHEFGSNLIIKAADPHDIIIMKSATSRLKDIDDISSIINKTPINWNVLIDEAEEQISLGNEKAVLSIGYTLEELIQLNKAKIPSAVLNSLWKLLKQQSKNKNSKAKKTSKNRKVG